MIRWFRVLSRGQGSVAVLASAVQTHVGETGSLFKPTPNPTNVSLQASKLGWQNFLLWTSGRKQKGSLKQAFNTNTQSPEGRHGLKQEEGRNHTWISWIFKSAVL